MNTKIFIIVGLGFELRGGPLGKNPKESKNFSPYPKPIVAIGKRGYRTRKEAENAKAAFDKNLLVCAGKRPDPRMGYRSDIYEIKAVWQ